MPTFIPGQRWISDTEPELGLGTVIQTEFNRVTILYLAAQERRTYAADNAPLTRVQFAVGDIVTHTDGAKLRVTNVSERDGLTIYRGTELDGHDALEFAELELSHFIQFNRPHTRLLAGQIDPPRWYALRLATLRRQGSLEQSPVWGLCGARTSLIAHQLYIAHEVSRRVAPRVLLADEVGLGKTIEAGLILHRQLLTGRAARVLIVVPEALLYQWLIEMRRRFNLRFSLFDETRCLDEGEENPFAAENLVLCSLELLADFPDIQDDCLAAGWDLCVIDEAHHLQWSESDASDDYRFVERLAAQVPGLLLLTATPEQLGRASHFARLRLLDPHRFGSFQDFVREEEAYQPLMAVIDALLTNATLTAPQLEQLRDTLRQDKADDLLAALNGSEREAARRDIVELLLDRHGTGRVFFRNTRSTVAGFPERLVHAYPLPAPPRYLETAGTGSTLEALVQPEGAYRKATGDAEPWWRIDPRVAWLGELLRSLRPQKVLVICAQAKTATDLEEALRSTYGVKVAAFHEHLSIVARDRAAAWFVDDEDGAQVLVCSEIGSEGRNFQFAQHLVLFDLPLGPDLLEQRIGRLDRIGQRNAIHIHVPYLEKTAGEALFHWYHKGLNAFAQTCPVGQAVLQGLEEDRAAALRNPTDSARLDETILRTARSAESYFAALQAGRDRLLELNSCRPEVAARLVAAVAEADSDPHLWTYMENVFDSYGVNVEEHSPDCFILSTGEHLREAFPELPDEGATVTVNRAIALAREDMLFLTWEHPMVRGAMDLIMSSGHGNATVVDADLPDLPPDELLLEAVFVLECPAPKRLQAGRYLPPTVIRVVLDARRINRADSISSELLDSHSRALAKESAVEVIREQRELIDRLLKSAEDTASQPVAGIAAKAAGAMLDSATKELKRLAALRRLNGTVRQDEIDQLKEDVLELHGYIQNAQLRLDAVRVVLTT